MDDFKDFGSAFGEFLLEVASTIAEVACLALFIGFIALIAM